MRVLVTRRLSIEPGAVLGPGIELDLHDEESALPRAALLERVRGAHGLVATLSDRVDEELLAQAGLLRVVSNHAVGVDNIDLAACSARRIRVTNTPDVVTEATADLAFAILLAVARRVREGERMMRENRFKGWAPTMLLGRELRGATLGIHGMGRIGHAVARRAVAFGMHVIHCSRSATPVFKQVTFPELLAQSDFLSIHCPFTKETHHAYSAEQLAAMKPGAVLINTARGPIVDEAALVAALESGRLGGAGLDVFEHEPLVHPGLVRRDDVVLLPHLGSATQETRAHMARLALGDAARVLRGEEPLHPVNPFT